MANSASKGILFSSSLVTKKTTRSSAGVILFTMKAGLRITEVRAGEDTADEKLARLRKNKLPATGISLYKPGEQLTIG